MERGDERGGSIGDRNRDRREREVLLEQRERFWNTPSLVLSSRDCDCERLQLQVPSEPPPHSQCAMIAVP